MDANIIIAIASVFIACCALGVTVWQGVQNRQHNRLSVKPLLTFGHVSNVARDICSEAFILENCGVGPAVIKNFALFYKGKEVARNNGNDYNDFLEEKMSNFMGTECGFLMPNSIVNAKAKKIMWKVKYNFKNDTAFLTEFINQLDLLIEYYSIYEHKMFILDTREARRFLEQNSL